MSLALYFFIQFGYCLKYSLSSQTVGYITVVSTECTVYF